jgi:signal transduction histidine kinase
LAVEGDAAKVQRIAQNLILNALGATRRGGVRVVWGDRNVPGAEQWMLCVQDTGPGLQLQSVAAPMEQALLDATEKAHESDPGAAPPTLSSESAPRAPADTAGEGIGLSIVKRLCELLDASLELETAPGAGTTFRVIFPRAYLRDSTA